MDRSLPNDRGYTPDHVWAQRVEGVVRVGLTPRFALALRGSPVRVRLPDVGARLCVATPCAEVESAKASVDVYAPCDGAVVAHNPDLMLDACLDDRWGSAWLWAMTADDLSHLWPAERYASHAARPHR